MAPTCIVGAGAIGSALASLMEANGCDYSLYSRSPGPRIVSSPWGHYKPEAVGLPWPPGQCEYAILAVKAYDTAHALKLMRTYRVEASVLVVVQNGLGGLEEASKRHKGVTAAGVADFGVLRRGPTVLVTGLGRLVLGCPGWDCTGLLDGLTRCLQAGGVEVILVPDIEPYRWLKLAINAAINTVTAILGESNGVILRNPYAQRAAVEIARIVAEEARERGVQLAGDAVEETLRVAEATASNVSSTLQDLLSGSRTEVDYILGPLAGRGELRLLYLLLKALEESRRDPAVRANQGIAPLPQRRPGTRASQRPGL
ncbi:MAG: 2-dehydropantoate 2-reductase [Desulfurococcales archaeon]|nr:2-dehydropantoate 2-reductase [Desulfurococcales archaeon]